MIDITYTLTDATGAVISSAPNVSFTSAAPSIVGVTATGLTGKATGATVVGAALGDGTTLAGALLAVVPGSPTDVPCGSAIILGCSLEFPPELYWKPGLTAQPLRVWIWSNPNTCDSPPTVEARQGSPDGVDFILDPSPVAVTGGRLVSVASGSTLIRELVNDLECGRWLGTVGPDLEGSWRASCSNGDTGTRQVGSISPTIRYSNVTHEGYGGRNLFNDFNVTSTSCLTGTGGYQCTATGLTGWSAPWIPPKCPTGTCVPRDGVGVCSAQNPCAPLRVEDCAGARHAAESATYLGGEFRSNGCSYTRGNGTCAATDPCPDLGAYYDAAVMACCIQCGGSNCTVSTAFAANCEAAIASSPAACRQAVSELDLCVRSPAAQPSCSDFFGGCDAQVNAEKPLCGM